MDDGAQSSHGSPGLGYGVHLSTPVAFAQHRTMPPSPKVYQCAT